jgi:hypothetical protein
MKNKNLRLGILALALVIGAYSSGCPTDDPPTVTSVTVTTANGKFSVGLGQTLQFFASVSGTNNPAETVTWSIVETGPAVGTSINSDGLLSVAANETKASLTIKAISTVDPTKSDAVTVAVGDPKISIGADVYWGREYGGDYVRDIIITFSLSAGKWTSLPDINIVKNWYTDTGTPSAFTGTILNVLFLHDNDRVLRLTRSCPVSSTVPAPSGTVSFSATLVTAKLNEMKSYTSLINDNLVAGKTTDTDSAWEHKTQ